jgi:hypothetical protein
MKCLLCLSGSVLNALQVGGRHSVTRYITLLCHINDPWTTEDVNWDFDIHKYGKRNDVNVRTI